MDADHPQVITGTLARMTSSMAAFKAVKAAECAAEASDVCVRWCRAHGRRQPPDLPWADRGDIAAAVKTADQRLKKQNLADHFGDISLSIKDLRQISQEMVKTKSLEKMGRP